jgi:hypothetical protein
VAFGLKRLQRLQQCGKLRGPAFIIRLYQFRWQQT